MQEIKVIGVGGGGCRTVNHMMAAGMDEVECIAMDTDVRTLNESDAPLKLHLGWQAMRRFRGLYHGVDPSMGRMAAEDSIYDIRAVLRGAELVIVVAALGGGTGTGAAPVIAEEARQMGAATAAITCTPFGFEGARRRECARQGMETLAMRTDCICNISAARFMSMADPKDTLTRAYQSLDRVLYQTVQGLTSLVSDRHRIINVKLSELKSHLRGCGYGTVGIGEGSGPAGAVQAVAAALDSPLLEWPVEQASRIFLNITGGEQIVLDDVAEAAGSLNTIMNAEADLIFNIAFSDPRPDRVLAVVICAGRPAGTVPAI